MNFVYLKKCLIIFFSIYRELQKLKRKTSTPQATPVGTPRKQSIHIDSEIKDQKSTDDIDDQKNNNNDDQNNTFNELECSSKEVTNIGDETTINESDYPQSIEDMIENIHISSEENVDTVDMSSEGIGIDNSKNEEAEKKSTANERVSPFNNEKESDNLNNKIIPLDTVSDLASTNTTNTPSDESPIVEQKPITCSSSNDIISSQKEEIRSRLRSSSTR